MKTVQKTIWMRYLLLGVFNVTILGFSCGKISEYAQNAQFYFINDTDYKIKLINQYREYVFLPRQTTVINDEQVGDGNVDVEDFRDIFTDDISLKGKELIFQIGDKCLKYTTNSERSIINLKNYSAEKINKITYKFTYTFTEADYNRAVTCP